MSQLTNSTLRLELTRSATAVTKATVEVVVAASSIDTPCADFGEGGPAVAATINGVPMRLEKPGAGANGTFSGLPNRTCAPPFFAFDSVIDQATVDLTQPLEVVVADSTGRMRLNDPNALTVSMVRVGSAVTAGGPLAFEISAPAVTFRLQQSSVDLTHVIDSASTRVYSNEGTGSATGITVTAPTGAGEWRWTMDADLSVPATCTTSGCELSLSVTSTGSFTIP